MAPTFASNSTSYANDASGTSNPALAFPSANQAGSLLIMAASWGTSGGLPNTATITDTQGNTWALVKFQDYAADTQCAALFAAYNAKAGANSVTISWSGSVQFRRTSIGEYTGVATTSALDGTPVSASGAGSTTTNAITSGNTTTTQAGDLIIGVSERTWEDGTTTAGTSPLSYTIRDGVSGLKFEDAVAGAAGGYAATWTFTAGTNQHFAAITAAFKASAGAGGNIKGGQFIPFFT